MISTKLQEPTFKESLAFFFFFLLLIGIKESSAFFFFFLLIGVKESSAGLIQMNFRLDLISYSI